VALASAIKSSILVACSMIVWPSVRFMPRGMCIWSV